ncbi:hypothetical protein RHCRD62_70270 [Rhodococcus sp. RD6.2]|nr:hypothetical protein RHCRD62_70270 [Rhodococcus sp. RD6.2]
MRRGDVTAVRRGYMAALRRGRNAAARRLLRCTGAVRAPGLSPAWIGRPTPVAGVGVAGTVVVHIGNCTGHGPEVADVRCVQGSQDTWPRSSV